MRKRIRVIDPLGQDQPFEAYANCPSFMKDVPYSLSALLDGMKVESDSKTLQLALNEVVMWVGMDTDDGEPIYLMNISYGHLNR